jgi:hypothetical protein
MQASRAYACTFTGGSPGHGAAPEQEFAMKVIDPPKAGSPAENVWKALRPSLVPDAQPAEAVEPKNLEQPSCATVNDIRRLMLQSQEFRSIMPSAEVKSADRGKSRESDRTTLDTVFACLAICADEERRAISFGSNEGATAMRRSMHAIKKKFGIS